MVSEIVGGKEEHPLEGYWIDDANQTGFKHGLGRSPFAISI